jgi:hypothetical protein
MLFLKPGVRLTGIRPELLIAIIAAERVYAEAGCDFTTTSCVDGKHKAPASLHYAGAAIDIRTRNVPAANLPKLVALLKECLGSDFDVVSETDHLHVEWQAKHPLTA